MTDQTPETATEFVTGESDPADFTVDQVTAHLATASPDEFARVQDLESGDGGKGRKGITGLTYADATEPEAPTENADGLAVGDEYTTEDGHTAVVVSITGT